MKMLQESDIHEIVDRVMHHYRKPAIMLHRPYPPHRFTHVRSRLGGLPQLPDDMDWPTSLSHGRPLHFLCQIDCAELPSIDGHLPACGMLFFFADDADDQIWDSDDRDSIRVIHAPDAPCNQSRRAAPTTLQPVYERYRYSRLRWVLKGESAPATHTEWPLVPITMDSWPDYSAIYQTEHVARIIEAYLDSDTGEALVGKLTLPAADIYEGKVDLDVAMDLVGEYYDERVREARVAQALTIAASPGANPPEGATDILEAGLTQPSDPRWQVPTAFPQLAVMIERMARLVIARTSKVIGYQGYQDQARQDELRRIENEGRRWMADAQQMGLGTQPPNQTRADFRNWLAGLSGAPGSLNLFSLHDLADIHDRGLLATIDFTVGAPETAAHIPTYFLEALHHHHLPVTELAGQPPSPAVHQMLGYPRSCQDAPSVDEPEILLLHLATDYGVHMVFGDVGNASFWISPQDLAERRFDRVRAEVVGH